jgi:endoglucanase
MPNVYRPIGLLCLGLTLGAAGCGGSKQVTGPGPGGAGTMGTGAAGGTGGGGTNGGGGAAAGQSGSVKDASAAGGATGDGASTSGLTPVQAHGQLKVVGTQLVDQSGHPVQLKGVSSQWLNLESKTFPESKPAIQYARDNWKLSVIRAAMGVDTAGGYLGTGTGANAAQATMLSKVNTIIQNAIDLGIYVIVDWHTSDAVTATTTQATQASAFFTMIATQYGASPNVIYEDYNEPAVKGVLWAQIKPYHEAVIAAIRAVDPDNLIVLGTPTYSQDVDLAAMDQITDATNILYTLHFYACTHKQPLRDKANTAIGLGLPIFITEFGATPADGGVVKSGDNDVCEGEADTWFAWMAQNNISGASWKLDQCTDSSCILTADAPVDGPWTDNFLTSDTGGTPIDGGEKGGGHGLFVVDWMRQ